jgi:outer membrane biosynthesis protein TonB
MTTSARTVIRAAAASAGLHGLVVLLVAWFLAVLPSIERMLPEVVREEVKEEEPVKEETVQEVAIELVPVEDEEKREEEKEKEKVEEEKRGAVAAKKQFVLPNGAVAERDPSRKKPAFISSQNMRAASTAEADPDADPNLISQEGYDLPMLSLNAVDFKDGVEDSTSEMEARASETAVEAVPPDQVVEKTPADVIADRPPEVQRPVAMPPVEAAGVVRAEVRDEERTNNPAAPLPERREEVKEVKVRERPPEVKVKELDAGERPPGPKVKPKAVKPAALPVPKERDPLNLSGKPRVEEVRTKSRGGVTERGDQGSVDAEATPEGRYAKVIHERVGLVWNRKMSTIRGLTGVGSVEVEFEIDPEGRISGVQLVDPGKANPILEDVCLSAIMAAKLPPPPQELIEEMREPLTGGKMRRRFTFHRL